MSRIILRRSRLIAFLMIFFFLFSTNISLTAFAKAKQPKLNVTNITMLQNQTYTVQVYCLKKNQTVSFSIKNENIASITKTNKKTCTFKSIAVGKTKLVATIYKNDTKQKTLKCTILVTPPAVSIQFKKKSYSLSTGQSINLRSLVTVKPAKTAEIPVFTVSDSSSLRVTPNGFATGISAGKVTVTATIANGKSDQIVIQIKGKVKN